MDYVVQNLLVSFDALSPEDQDFALGQMMLRAKNPVIDEGPISEEAMLEIADAGFQRLDLEEAHGKTETR